MEEKDTREQTMAWDEMLNEAAVVAALVGARRAGKQFVGVQQRPSSRWVAEIKDTIQKIRVWLGTYDTAKEVARAYDEAPCILHSANTRTNFRPYSLAFNPTPALPSKITSLLQRLRTRNNTSASFPDSSLINKQEIQGEEEKQDGESRDLFDTQFTDFLNDHEDYSISNGCYISNTTANAFDYLTMSLESCLTEKDSSGRDLGLDYCSFSDSTQPSSCDNIVEEGPDMEALDFHFVDDTGSSRDYSPFEMAEEIEEPVEAENFLNKPSMLRAAMKRMKYERKFSTSLYTFNGIPECLKLRLGLENVKGGQ